MEKGLFAEKKFRVAIHTLTHRRDFSSRYILGKILEHYGCECYITSIRDYTRVLKYWRPHAFIHTTSSKMKEAINSFPEAQFFFYAGEGSEGKKVVTEVDIINDELTRKKTERMFLWGKNTFDKLVNHFEMRGETKTAESLRTDPRIQIIGYPRSDVANFMPLSEKKERNTIGLVGCFHIINHTRGQSTLNECFGNPNSVNTAMLQLRILDVYLKIIEFVLDNTSYNISIRPYPAENISQYMSMKYPGRQEFMNPKYKGRVEIDQTPDFATWASKKMLLITSQSTSITDAYIMGIPVINVDVVSNTFEEIKKRGPVHKLLGSTPLQPASLDELFTYILNPDTIPINMHKLQKFWEDEYSMLTHRSKLLTVASNVIQCLNKGAHHKNPILSKKVLTLADDALYYVRNKKNKYNPNQDYKRGLHSIPKEYDLIFNKIISGQKGHFV